MQLLSIIAHAPYVERAASFIYIVVTYRTVICLALYSEFVNVFRRCTDCNCRHFLLCFMDMILLQRYSL